MIQIIPGSRLTWVKIDPLPGWDQECPHVLRLNVVPKGVLAQVDHKWYWSKLGVATSVNLGLSSIRLIP